MNTLSNQNFGLVIAYLLPGFVSLWGVSYFSPTVDAWITASQQNAPTVAGFMYVTLASLAAGVTVSAVRWAMIDHLHHATGIVPPAWKFANLEGKLQGYLTLIENHYRYYQFYSNMFVAAAFSFAARVVSGGLQSVASHVGHGRLPRPGDGSLRRLRDTLRKYYSSDTTVTQFPSPLTQERSTAMTNGGHKKVESVKKPVVKEQAPVTKPASPQSETNPRSLTDCGLSARPAIVAGRHDR